MAGVTIVGVSATIFAAVKSYSLAQHLVKHWEEKILAAEGKNKEHLLNLIGTGKNTLLPTDMKEKELRTALLELSEILTCAPTLSDLENALSEQFAGFTFMEGVCQMTAAEWIAPLRRIQTEAKQFLRDHEEYLLLLKSAYHIVEAARYFIDPSEVISSSPSPRKRLTRRLQKIRRKIVESYQQATPRNL